MRMRALFHSFLAGGLCVCILLTVPAWLAPMPCMAAASGPLTPDQYLRVRAGGHTSAVFKMQFTPDGQRLISVGADKTARVWSLAGAGEIGDPLRARSGWGDDGTLMAAALVPDGDGAGHTWLAVAGCETQQMMNRAPAAIHIFDLSTGQLEQNWCITGNRGVVDSLCYSGPKLRLLASASWDGAIRIWKLGDATSAAALKPPVVIGPVKTRDGNCPVGIAFSPDEDLIAAVYQDYGVRIWNAATGDKVTSWECSEGAPRCVSWAGGILAVGTQGIADARREKRKGVICLYDASHPDVKRSWKLLDVITAVPGSDTAAGVVNQVSLSSDGRHVLAGGSNGIAAVWTVEDSRGQVTSPDPVTSFHDAADPNIWAVALSPNGQMAASADTRGHIHVWSAQGDSFHNYVAQGSVFRSLAWDPAPDTYRVAFDTHEGGVTENAQVFDFNAARLPIAADADPAPGAKATWPGDQHQVDGQQAVLRQVEVKGDSPGTADEVVVQAQPGGKAQKIGPVSMGPGERVWTYTLVRASLLAVGSQYGLKLYDLSHLNSGTLDGWPYTHPNSVLVGHDGGVTALAVSPDGRYLASAGTDETVRIWLLPTADQPGKPVSSDSSGTIYPLVSLFCRADGKWIEWTQDGYYACSDGGADMAEYQTNFGLQDPPTITPLGQRQGMCHPPILRSALKVGSVAGVIALQAEWPRKIEAYNQARQEYLDKANDLSNAQSLQDNDLTDVGVADNQVEALLRLGAAGGTPGLLNSLEGACTAPTGGTIRSFLLLVNGGIASLSGAIKGASDAVLKAQGDGKVVEAAWNERQKAAQNCTAVAKGLQDWASKSGLWGPDAQQYVQKAALFLQTSSGVPPGDSVHQLETLQKRLTAIQTALAGAEVNGVRDALQSVAGDLDTAAAQYQMIASGQGDRDAELKVLNSCRARGAAGMKSAEDSLSSLERKLPDDLQGVAWQQGCSDNITRWQMEFNPPKFLPPAVQINGKPGERNGDFFPLTRDMHLVVKTVSRTLDRAFPAGQKALLPGPPELRVEMDGQILDAGAPTGWGNGGAGWDAADDGDYHKTPVATWDVPLPGAKNGNVVQVWAMQDGNTALAQDWDRVVLVDPVLDASRMTEVNLAGIQKTGWVVPDRSIRFQLTAQPRPLKLTLTHDQAAEVLSLVQKDVVKLQVNGVPDSKAQIILEPNPQWNAGPDGNYHQTPAWTWNVKDLVLPDAETCKIGATVADAPTVLVSVTNPWPDDEKALANLPVHLAGVEDGSTVDTAEQMLVVTIDSQILPIPLPVEAKASLPAAPPSLKVYVGDQEYRMAGNGGWLWKPGADGAFSSTPTAEWKLPITLGPNSNSITLEMNGPDGVIRTLVTRIVQYQAPVPPQLTAPPDINLNGVTAAGKPVQPGANRVYQTDTPDVIVQVSTVPKALTGVGKELEAGIQKVSAPVLQYSTTANSESANVKLDKWVWPRGADGSFTSTPDANTVITLHLLPGQKETLTAWSLASGTKGKVESISLLYQAPPEKYTLHVLAVGVSKYPNLPGAFQLHGANDARNLEQYLAANSASYYGHVDPVLLLNEDATPAKILDACKTMKVHAKPGDTLVVFLAGHGISQGGRYWFASPEISSDDVEYGMPTTGATSFRELFASLNGCKGNVVMMLDVCHAGRGSSEAGSDTVQHTYDEVNDNKFYLVAACGSTQESMEDPDTHPEQGLFTEEFLRALEHPVVKNQAATSLNNAMSQCLLDVQTRSQDIYARYNQEGLQSPFLSSGNWGDPNAILLTSTAQKAAEMPGPMPPAG